jgi:hypothetical protein
MTGHFCRNDGLGFEIHLFEITITNIQRDHVTVYGPSDFQATTSQGRALRASERYSSLSGIRLAQGEFTSGKIVFLPSEPLSTLTMHLTSGQTLRLPVPSTCDGIANITRESVSATGSG